MKRKTLVLIGAFLVACGDDGGDDGNATQRLCDDLKAKVEECNLNVDTSGGCVSNPPADVVCGAQCTVAAECAQITGPAESNSYYQCLAVCSGGSEDDFVCADGSGFLPQEGVCDGAAQCPDGSDEAGCNGTGGSGGSGGAPDGGN